jgi:crotonobetainyl-CoA:carnitine CoA-transferase CaiB-like acyl-CoA transferase
MEPGPPLAGVRVVSIAVNVPGPVAAARLRELGADVVKVEPPSGDFLARAAPAWYAELVAGQRVETVDLKSGTGQARVHELLAAADVLITSSRPSSLARLGLDPTVLVGRYPALCVVSVVGHHPPNAERAGHDVTYQAEAGLVSPPHLPPTLVSDLAGAEETVSAALALLVGRARTGRGGRLEVSLADAARRLAAPRRHGLTTPGGVLGGGLATYRLYDAADEPIAVAALEPQFAARLGDLLGVDPMDANALARAFATRRAAEWEGWALEHDLPIVAVSAGRGSA